MAKNPSLAVVFFAFEVPSGDARQRNLRQSLKKMVLIC